MREFTKKFNFELNVVSILVKELTFNPSLK